MKKYISIMFILIACLLMAVPAYAGSIPEDLLSEDFAQVYFGEIKSVTPNGEDSTVTIVQKQNIKGEFTTDKEYVYNDIGFFASDTPEPEVGKIYLCGYFDENNPVYIWETSSLDTKTLKILNKTGGGMEERLEEYLNLGLFDEAEQKRLEKVGTKEAVSVGVIGGADGPTAVYVTSGVNIWLLLAVGGLFILFAAVIGIYIHKQKR